MSDAQIVEKMSDAQIMEKINECIDLSKNSDRPDCIAFSPKYYEVSKECFEKIRSADNNSIEFFGGCKTRYGYYKTNSGEIYLFEIYYGNILVECIKYLN